MRRAGSMAELLRYSCMADDGVILLKDGCLMAGCRLYGSDLDSSTPAERESVARSLNTALMTLSEDSMVHFISLRAPCGQYPAGSFSEDVARLMDEERRAYFTRPGNGFETRVYCFLTVRPPIVQTGRLKAFWERVLGRGNDSGYLGDERLGEFRHIFDRFASSLSLAFGGEALEGTDLLGAVNACVNGEFTVPESFSENPYDLDCLFARDLTPGSDVMVYDNRYTAVISLTTLPDFSSADMLSAINRMPWCQMWSLRFMPRDYTTAAAHIGRQFRLWHQRTSPLLDQILHMDSGRTDLNAAAKAADAQAAQQELDAGTVDFGHITNTIVLRDTDRASLAAHVAELQNVLARCAFGVTVEHRNAKEAFLGALPGHGQENCRKPFVNTLNCSHMVPLGATWTGPEADPCTFYPANSPCLLQAGTRGRQPFRLSLHVGDVGHTLVLGPTGAGKSTLLALYAAQFDRYPDSQLFVFDKGRSIYPLIHAMKNSRYYCLGRDDSPALCPLAHLDTSGDLAWAAGYVEMLVSLNGLTVTPSHRRLMQEAISNMAAVTSVSSERTLSSLYVDLQDRELKDALQGFTSDGLYGRYLDGDEDTLSYSKATAFELEELMGLGQKVVVPVLTYLFREIEKRLDGRPSLIILDEAWLMLDTPLFASRIREWLKVLRKANASVVLATQALSDVVRSEIGPAILDSCPTRILLPNSQINSAEMTRLYTGQLQLNASELSIIATAVPKREYYYMSPLGRRLFSLDLGPVQMAFAGSSGREDLATVDRLIAEHGDGWVRHWLEAKCPQPV